MRFVKDTVAVEGNVSLKIIPGPYSAFLECRSMDWTSVQLDTAVGEGKSLTFFAKSIPDSTNKFQSVYLGLKGFFYHDGKFVSSFKWETFEPISDFTKVQIEIPDPETDSLSIQIYGGAGNGSTDGCFSRSNSWIDHIHITDTEVINSTEEGNGDDMSFRLFPNPSNGVMFLDSCCSRFNQFYLYGMTGHLFYQGKLQGPRLDLSSVGNGMFYLRLTNEDYSVDRVQIIVIHQD